MFNDGVRLNPTWPVLRTYGAERLRRVAVPIGGIGTGTVSLGGRGNLRDWEIVNRPAKGFVPNVPITRNMTEPRAFFAVRVQAQDQPPVTRLLEMQLDPFNFADALLGVLAQRLARTVCATCKEPYHPSREEYETLAHAYGEKAFARLSIPYDDAFRLVRGSGCQACRRTGYKGRVALHELLVVTDEIKSLILSRAPAAELLTTARRQGLTTLIQDGVLKCIQGLTDYKQVQAVAMR